MQNRKAPAGWFSLVGGTGRLPRRKEYSPASFFPGDGGRRRECRRVLEKTHLDEESGDYMEAVNEARFERAAAHIEETYIHRMEEIEEACRWKKKEILRLQHALNQLSAEIAEEELAERLGEKEWDYEYESV